MRDCRLDVVEEVQIVDPNGSRYYRFNRKDSSVEVCKPDSPNNLDKIQRVDIVFANGDKTLKIFINLDMET